MAEKSGSLEGVAKRENWIELGEALSEAMSQPELYGLRTSSEVLQRVANIKGKQSDSLKKTVNVSAWLKQNYPDIFAARPPWLGMTLVMFLMKMNELDPSEAKKSAAEVFAGHSGQVALKKKYDELRKKRKQAPNSVTSTAISAPERAQQFETIVTDYFERFGAKLFNTSHVTILSGKVIEPVKPDLVVDCADGRRFAIETKSYRSQVNRRDIIGILGQLALIQKLVPEILMIVPEGSAYDLRRMNDLRDKLSLKGIRFATLPEKRAERATDLRVTE